MGEAGEFRPGSAMRLREPAALDAALGFELSAEQRAAACAPLAPGVIVAGAGTGKTTVMAARVVWLIGAGLVDPDRVLGLTFTRRAAGELAQRIRSDLARAGLVDPDDLDAGEPVVATYDAFAGDVLREYGLRFGLAPPRRLLTGAQRYQVVVDVLRDPAWAFEYVSDFAVSTVANRVLRLDAELVGHLVTPEAAEAATRAFAEECAAAPRQSAALQDAVAVARQRLEFLTVVRAYREAKRALGLWEFGDQMAAAVGLAQAEPVVGQRLRERFRVVLLDEYQDTSSAQVRLLTSLFSGEDAAAGRGHPVSAVGDPLQAIYGWRGAAADTMGRARRDFPRADGTPAEQFVLSVNRRSAARVLDVANAVGPGVGDAPLVPLPGRDAGDVVVASRQTFPEEIDWVVGRILACHDAGQAPRWSDIAVLARRNADLAGIHDRLVSLDVPVEIVGLGGLLDLPEIGQITATLRLLVDVLHNPSVITLLGGPRWGFPPADLEALGRRAAELAATAAEPVGRAEGGPVCLLDAVSDPGPGRFGPATLAALGAFAAELSRLRMHRNDPPARLAALVVETIGLRAEVAARPGRWGRAASDQIDRFLQAVAAFEDTAGQATLWGLLAWFDAQATVGDDVDQAALDSDDSVKLLTVHAAKGLEWDVVALPALTAGVFPSARGGDDWTARAEVLPAPLRGDAASVPQVADVSRAGLEEYRRQLRLFHLAAEDRLAHVALTRARRTVLASTSWWRAGKAKAWGPSSVFTAVAGRVAARGAVLDLVETPAPANPLGAVAGWALWPQAPADRAELAAAASGVLAAARAAAAGGPAWSAIPPLVALELSAEDASVVRGWTGAAECLASRARERGRSDLVRLPRSLSVSQMMAARTDPVGLAEALARPMPRPVDARASLGTRFHAWVQARFALPPSLEDGPLDAEEAWPEPGEEPAGLLVEDDLAVLTAAFLDGPYADRVPLAVECPYVLSLPDRELRGRIDAVYSGDGKPYRYQVVDWKTARGGRADPLQLGLYRLAWARAHDCPLAAVDAVFYYVRARRVVRPADLPGEADLLALLGGLG